MYSYVANKKNIKNMSTSTKGFKFSSHLRTAGCVCVAGWTVYIVACCSGCVAREVLWSNSAIAI